MKSLPSQSTTDHAFLIFKRLHDEKGLYDSGSPDMTEADTRAKLIDPLFKEALGWMEQDIRREEPVADGFVDYVIGAEFPFFHIEAKRLNPRFRIQSKSRARVLSLSGPHLLGNKDIRSFLEQTARYAFELGTEFTILTNGDQFILFKTRLEGKRWRDGIAYVWHDVDDILNSFAEFFNVLAAEHVRAGSLNQLFSSLDGLNRQYFLPRQFIYSADQEYVRNRFWNRISSVFAPLLSDQPEDEELQLEIIRECYISSPLSDQADLQINSLLSDTPTRFLIDTQVTDIGPGKSKAFHYDIEKDIKSSRASTYVLTGGVGSGKTTFLKRYARVLQPGMIKAYCVWIHIDYLPLGAVDLSNIGVQLEEFTYRNIREILRSEYAERLPSSGSDIRDLFSSQIKEAKLTRLYGIDEASGEWHSAINQIVDALYKDDKAFVEAFLADASRKGRRIVVVLDNSDQLGESFQEALFLFSQKLSRRLNALTVVALREEKYFAAYRRGIFDAYGDRRFHIGSPNLHDVLKRRLEWGLLKYERLASEKGADSEEIQQVSSIIQVFIWSTTERNQNIVRMLSCVSNGDMRYALGMFREFVSSGNTNIEKILGIVKKHGHYSVPFHEFAKSAILGSRRFFRGDRSHIVNLFVPSGVAGASHLTACRILDRLASAQAAISSHGEGFVDTSMILREYRQTFGVAEDLIKRTEELLLRGLIESEPPRIFDLRQTDALRITAAGAYYWQYLARSFAFLDIVYVDTPIADRDLSQELSAMSEETDLSLRFERVRKFIGYLEREEDHELQNAKRNASPFGTPIIAEIREQVEKEITIIRQKTGASDLRINEAS